MEARRLYHSTGTDCCNLWRVSRVIRFLFLVVIAYDSQSLRHVARRRERTVSTVASMLAVTRISLADSALRPRSSEAVPCHGKRIGLESLEQPRNKLCRHIVSHLDDLPLTRARPRLEETSHRAFKPRASIHSRVLNCKALPEQCWVFHARTSARALGKACLWLEPLLFYFSCASLFMCETSVSLFTC